MDLGLAAMGPLRGRTTASAAEKETVPLKSFLPAVAGHFSVSGTCAGRRAGKGRQDSGGTQNEMSAGSLDDGESHPERRISDYPYSGLTTPM